MYLKDKKTVNLSSIVINKESKDLFKVLCITSTGRYLLYSLKSKYLNYNMSRDFTVRGINNRILLKLELVKKIKYKRKRYKNG